MNHGAIAFDEVTRWLRRRRRGSMDSLHSGEDNGDQSAGEGQSHSCLFVCRVRVLAA
jgi:hypothetical protein